MKTIKYLSIFIALFSISSCVNQKKKDEEKIKQTITKYWKSVKDNNIEEGKKLIEDDGVFSGIIQMDMKFLNKNYEKINPNDVLLKNIEIKDTILTFTNVKEKYVQYVIKRKNDSLKKPLIITFIFFKPIGYDKIFNPVILQNHIGWDK